MNEDEKIDETIEKIDEVIEKIEDIKPPESGGQDLGLGILVGQMGAKIEALESESKILADKIQELEYVRQLLQESISNLFQRINDLEVKQDGIIEEIEEPAEKEKEEIAGDLIEIEIPPEPAPVEEKKTKKRHFI
jgi:chromosome segregation ATPase